MDDNSPCNRFLVMQIKYLKELINLVLLLLASNFKDQMTP